MMHRSFRVFLVALAALAALTSVSPASAFVVEVTTSVAIADRDDTAAVETAIKSAVDEVVSEAIAFTPTLIVLTHARMVGDRLWLRLLIADKAGEQAFGELDEDDAPVAPIPERTELKI
ncbi:MAG TPA: hypothetical protein VGL09_13525 [Methylomirabilota bacterium]|jgi:hypothetical protein